MIDGHYEHLEEFVRDYQSVMRLLHPVAPDVGASVDFGDMMTHWYKCGECGQAIDRMDKYCRACGRPIKWE